MAPGLLSIAWMPGSCSSYLLRSKLRAWMAGGGGLEVSQVWAGVVAPGRLVWLVAIAASGDWSFIRNHPEQHTADALSTEQPRGPCKTHLIGRGPTNTALP